MLSEKERMRAAFGGGPLDRFPVAVPYIFLLQADHWVELTRQPPWTFYAWLLQDPEVHVQLYRDFDEQLPFDLLQPQMAPTREEREHSEIVKRDAHHYRLDRRTGQAELLNEDLPHAAAVANETRHVWSRADVSRLVRVPPAEELLASGRYDHISAAHEMLDKYIVNGVVGTFWQCTAYVGETNLLALLHDDPGLITELSQRLLERTIEQVRALAAAGCDAIYIDDALTTNDLISVPFYERFSVPYVRQIVQEIQRLGRAALLIYFGGVTDRLPQIASLGADALSVETSMKGYVNDLSQIADVVGRRMCLWGNIDPVGVVQDGAEEELERAVAEQIAVGRRLGRMVISTGSPITPRTRLRRIRRFIELARELGAQE